MIAVSGLNFAFGQNAILHDVSFALRPGSFNVILGPNGSGKTTLLRCVAGVLKPQAGSVMLGDRSLTSFSVRERARLMAWVAQSTRMDFDFTVVETVLMGRFAHLGRFVSEKPRDIELCYEALREAGVEHLAQRLVTHLSGGELQRVLVARALVQQTPVLMLDEPVSHLDIRHQVDILQAVRRRVDSTGVTALCVLHDLNQALHYADHVVLLHQGRVVAQGHPAEVLQPQMVEEVYGISVQTHMPSGGESAFLLPQW